MSGSYSDELEREDITDILESEPKAKSKKSLCGSLSKSVPLGISGLGIGAVGVLVLAGVITLSTALLAHLLIAACFIAAAGCIIGAGSLVAQDLCCEQSVTSCLKF